MSLLQHQRLIIIHAEIVRTDQAIVPSSNYDRIVLLVFRDLINRLDQIRLRQLISLLSSKRTLIIPFRDSRNIHLNEMSL